MAYYPFVPGQQPMSSSQGVVLASDQSPVSIAGTVGVSNFPLTQNVSGSVAVAGSVTALQGTNPWTVQLSSGSVITTTGNSSVQVVGLMPAQSVSGVGVFNIAGSVATTGSVTALQGTNPWVIGNSSMMLTAGTNMIGSVTTLQGTQPWLSQIVSSVAVAGTYPVNATSVLNGLGMLVQGVRNDNMASVISSVDGAYSPFMVGPVGELITAYAPMSKWAYNVSSVNTGTSVIAVPAGGAGIYNYITGMSLSSYGANSVLARFATGPGITSTLLQVVVPVGLTQLQFTTPIKSQNNAVITASISAATVLYVNAQGFTSKT